jgi:signal peptidase
MTGAGEDDADGPAADPDIDGHATGSSVDGAGADDGGEGGGQQWGGESHEGNDDEWAFVIRDLLVTVLAVLLVGGYLFAISGVWPPMVAIESGSMDPNMEVNDMVFVMESGRFQPENAIGDTGVVPARVGEQAGYEQFGRSGDVIIFEPGGNGAETPIIHRAMFWVEEGENWCEMADPAYLGRFEPSDANCEAPHDGFITKGDANPRYDQASYGESSQPVKPEWIVGTAELRFPRLGWFRLQL